MCTRTFSRSFLRSFFLASLLIAGKGALAAGYFSHSWQYDSAADYQFDPNRITVANGMTQLKSFSLPTGLAMQLNGFDQHAEIADTLQSGLALASDDFVFAAWVRIDSGGTFHGLLEKVGSSAPYAGVHFHLENLGAPGFRLRSILRAQNGIEKEFLASNAIRDAAWHQVVLAVDRTNRVLRYFVDGVPYGPVFDISGIEGSLANDGAFKIGLNNVGRLGGAIDEVYFWRFSGGLPFNLDALVRSHLDHQVIYSQQVVSAWSFDDSTGADNVGSNTLTLINAPAAVPANIQRVAYDAPYVQSACVAGGGQALYSASDVPGENGAAEIRYQLSTDGSTWLYFKPGIGWTAAPTDVAYTSPLHEVNENLPRFPSSSGVVCLRAFLVSNGVQPVALDSFAINPPPAQVALVNEVVAARPLPGSFRAIFETGTPAEAYLEYRKYSASKPASWKKTRVYKGGTVFGIDATGLSSNARYEYRARYRARGTGQVYQASPPGRVLTPPPPGTETSLTFSVWADSRPSPSIGHPVQPQIFYQLIGMVGADNPVFHVAVGDNVDAEGAAPFGQQKAFDLYRGWRDAYDATGGFGYMFFGVGNHDGEALWEPLRSIATFARLRATAQPSNGDLAQRYYSWCWGDALFIMLDGSGPASIDAAQEEWLMEQLNKAAKWKIVFNHYPLFNSNRRITDTAQRDRLHAAFLQHGVPVVFQAHDHWYADTMVDGIHYTTSGGAGSALHVAGQIFGEISKHHYLRVTLSPARMTVSTIQVSTSNDNGTILHSYCIPAPGMPPCP